MGWNKNSENDVSAQCTTAHAYTRTHTYAYARMYAHEPRARSPALIPRPRNGEHRFSHHCK